MTTKKKKAANVPNLRFPGFEGDWEKKKLGDIATFSKGKGISKSDIKENGINECIRYGELYTHYGEVINQIKSKTDVDTSNLVLSETNDVIIPASGETTVDIATASCVLKSGVALGGDLNIIKTDNDGVFLSYYLNSKKKIEIANLAQGISVVHLYSSQLATLSLCLPKWEEQNRISRFLALLDERIQTQNKIIEQLESLIKGIRDKLFCQKIRFPQFKEQWLQYRVSDFLTFFSTNSLSWEQLTYQPGTINNLHYGLIHQHESPVIDIDNFVLPSIKTEFVTGNYEYCQDGDIAFADASEDVEDVAKAIEFVNCKDRKIICGLHTIHGRDKLSITISGFKGYAFASSTFRRQIRQLAQGTKVFSISSKTFNDCFVGIPTKNEQQEITSFLAVLYKKLEVEKSCLSKYVIQKKHLLLNMFI